jgi:hypothetical protein
MLNTPFHLLDSIKSLRLHGRMNLYSELWKSSDEEQDLLGKFLMHEYKKEVYELTDNPPAFDADAAIWGAKVLFYSAQLILNRKNEFSEVSLYFDDTLNIDDPSAILSADLCLRFLPTLYKELLALDMDDPLVDVLRDILIRWTYSSLDLDLKSVPFDIDSFLQHHCLRRCLLDRVTEYKRVDMAEHPRLMQALKEDVADYGQDLWPGLVKDQLSEPET